MTAILGHNFIGGARSAAGTLFLQSLDAASGEALPYRFVQATPEEVDAAAEAAASAYPHYRQLPASRRAEFLDTIAAELDALDDDFVAIVCRETALPATRIQGERSRTSGQLRLFAEVLRRGDFHGARIDRARPERKPLPRVDLRQCRIGLGPVAVFGASNFPLAFSTAGGDTAAALAAGCPVVFKAHSGHMATAERVAAAILRAAERTGMPAGVFNMIYGGGVGERLVRHPAIQAVGFTLYMEMLERAVKAIRKGEQPNLEQPLGGGPEVNLRVPALIPEDYLPDVHARLILYKRIANAPDEEGLRELQVEMIDRFGLLPDPAKNLMRLTLLKLQAEKLGILKVDAGPQGGRIEFAADTQVDPLVLIKLIQGQPNRYKFEGATLFRFQVPMERPEERFNTLEALFERLTPQTT